jgi:hypothetical protein
VPLETNISAYQTEMEERKMDMLDGQMKAVATVLERQAMNLNE